MVGVITLRQLTIKQAGLLMDTMEFNDYFWEEELIEEMPMPYFYFRKYSFACKMLKFELKFHVTYF